MFLSFHAMRCREFSTRSGMYVEKVSDGERLGGAVPVHGPGVEQDGCKHKCERPIPEPFGEQRPGPECLGIGGSISQLPIFALSVRHPRIQLWSREGYAVLHQCRGGIFRSYRSA